MTVTTQHTNYKRRGSCCGISVAELEGAARAMVSRFEATRDGTACGISLSGDPSHAQPSKQGRRKQGPRPVNRVTSSRGVKIPEQNH